MTKPPPYLPEGKGMDKKREKFADDKTIALTPLLPYSYKQGI